MYNYFVSELDRTYKQAKRLAAKFKEAGFEPPSFPIRCPYSVEQLLDEEFFPKPPEI